MSTANSPQTSLDKGFVRRRLLYRTELQNVFALWQDSNLRHNG
jgi:hypothetical protein